jgi:hypothetical protein
VRLGGGNDSLTCDSMSFLKEVMGRRRAAGKAKKDGKDTTTSVTAPLASKMNHGPSDHVDDILIGVGCTGSDVSDTRDISESESCGVPSTPTSAGVFTNGPRHDGGSVGHINKANGRSFMEEYNTVLTSSAVIEHFVHTTSDFAVYLGISLFIISYANVSRILMLIGRTFTIKHKRLLTANLDTKAGDKMATLTTNNLMNGTASPAPMFCSVLFCPPPPSPNHPCNSN